MLKIKAFMATILCGLSTFSIMPSTDYSSYIPRNSNAIMRMAWQRTGTSLKVSIEKVGETIDTAKTAEQER